MAKKIDDLESQYNPNARLAFISRSKDNRLVTTVHKDECYDGRMQSFKRT